MFEKLPKRPRRRRKVDTVVPVEVAVLDRERDFDQMRGKRIEPDRETPLVVEAGPGVQQSPRPVEKPACRNPARQLLLRQRHAVRQHPLAERGSRRENRRQDGRAGRQTPPVQDNPPHYTVISPQKDRP